MKSRIAVTRAGYDNIGAVIKSLEYPYETLDEMTLGDASKLTGFDVVFINCSSTCQNHAKAASAALSRYVADGGTVYASDYAADYIAAAFPYSMRFTGKTGQQGRIEARVVDKGLRGLLGDAIALTFDMNSWEQITSVAPETYVYMEHDGSPVLVSFAHGGGQVIYTCFHNHAQTSQQEAELLRYLVIKPLMARASAELAGRNWVAKQELQETVGTITPGLVTPWYEYEFATDGPLQAVVNWKGDAHLKIALSGPDGSWQQDGANPPLSISIPHAHAGLWRFRVTGINAPDKNFPFVVVIGPSAQVNSRGPAAPPVSAWAPATTAAVEIELLDAIRILDSTTSSDEEIIDDSFEIRLLEE